ncbi:MAG: histidine phosphatase family protein [Candidatus Tumulicola sp.]
MGRAYVARHGETDWNRAARYQGRRESHLTRLGERQAAALAAELVAGGAGRIVSSPLARCTQTARPIAEALGLAVDTDDRLLEIAHGTWEGRLREDIERDDGARMQTWRHSPERVRFDGGESLAAVNARWQRFAESLDGKNDVIIVTHDVLVRLAILAAGGRPLADFWKPPVENGGYAVFEVRATRWRLIEECHRTHLAGVSADARCQAL